MRWAEGHTHNIRRSFLPILLSPFISPAEKIEFVFYAAYYLQALFFIAGTLCWLVAEIGLHQHVPQWTALLGWSLLFSNALALPLMNLGGLILEEAPGKDARGVLGAMGLSIALAPFQAWAALKGLVEKNEGPWYRTPKTGKVTDEVHHLRRLKLLGRWLLGPRGRNGNSHKPALVQAQPKPRLRPRHGGTCPNTNGTMSTTAPSSTVKSWGLGTAGQTCKWATTSSTTSAQTIFTTDVFTFSFWAVRSNGTASPAISAVFGYSSSSTCSSVTTIATMPSYTFTVTTTDTNFTPPAFSPASDVSVPAGSFFCWTVTVQTADNKTSFEWDSSADNTNLNSTQTIFIPEMVLVFAGLALLLPLGVGRIGRLKRAHA
jgi:hypothetical protein